MTSFLKSLARCAVALCLLFAVAFAQPQQQPKPKAAVYIMGNPEGRDALRSAVNTFLIKSGKYQMIAVDAIDVVAQEQRRQMSGSVSDGDIAALGRDAGAQYVCVVQRSELDGVSYVATRMVSVQSKVAELADIVELPAGGKVIDIIQWQIGSMLGMAVGPRPAGSAAGSGYIAARPAASQYPAQPAAASVGTSPPIRGTLVPGGGLEQKLVWLQKSADSHETYIVEVNADERIAPENTFEFVGGINITVVLRGVGGNRTVRLKSHGSMFIVKSNVTFVLDNNITLQGHPDNNNAMVLVYSSGKFRMNAGAAIVGNGNRGVLIEGGCAGCSANFEMSGGTISGNGRKDTKGGGVAVYGGTFTMIGGTITGNIASNGGGVCIFGFGNPTFNMRGGTISGNTAVESGGGVHVQGTFVKTGGTITGYKSDPTNGNAVKDEDGFILSRKGHAIYVSTDKRKETSAGPTVNFKDGSGAWDQ
jgi:hypothetical protein